MASPPWFEEFLLLALACLMIRSWRRSKPPRAAFIAVLVLVLVAGGLSVFQLVWPVSERDITIAVFTCVAAVVLPALLMMRPLFARLVKFVFPRARLVRSKRAP